MIARTTRVAATFAIGAVLFLFAGLYNFNRATSFSEKSKFPPPLSEMGRSSSIHANLFVACLTVFGVVFPVLSSLVTEDKISLMLATVAGVGFIGCGVWETDIWNHEHAHVCTLASASAITWSQYTLGKRMLFGSVPVALVLLYVYQNRKDLTPEVRHSVVYLQYAMVAYALIAALTVTFLKQNTLHTEKFA